MASALNVLRGPRSFLMNTTIPSHKETHACCNDHTDPSIATRCCTHSFLDSERDSVTFGSAAGHRNASARIADLSCPALMTTTLEGCFRAMRR